MRTLRGVAVAVAAFVLPATVCSAAESGPQVTFEEFRRLSVEDPHAAMAQGDALLEGEWAAAHPEWRREILMRMARAATLLADEAGLDAAVARLEALSESEHDEIAAAYAHFARASVWAEAGRLDDALRVATQAAEALAAKDEPVLRAVAEIELCDVTARGARSDLASLHCALARNLWAAIGDQYQLARADNFLSMIARENGDYDGAIMLGRRARGEFLRAGMPSIAIMMDDNLAGMYLDKGEAATALALSEGALREELAAGKAQHAVLSRMNIARAFAMLGRYPEAERAIATAIDEALQIGYEAGLPSLYQAQIEVAAAADDPQLTAQAAASLMEVMDRLATAEREKAIAEMEARYQTAEKQRRIDRLAHENEVAVLKLAATDEKLRRQRLSLLLVAVATGSFAAVALLLFLLNRAGRRRERELHVLSRTDFLTGTATRRAFMEALDGAFARAPAPAALMVIDADHFKRLNDEHGHLAGDRGLQDLVERVRGQIRADDVLGRLGGEVFGIVFPNIAADEAAQRAEAIRAAIASPPIDIGERSVTLTASIGVTMLDRARHATVEQWLEAADTATYDAKRAGRNRVAFGWAVVPAGG